MRQFERRDFLKLASCTVLSEMTDASSKPASPDRPPNLVIILADDLGYADVGCFGAAGIRTPNLDSMAARGVRLTDFYVAQPVCGASRAALLTGCYPNRIGILGAPGPQSSYGISDLEVTLAELLKQRNYATAIFGKWHLGDHPQFLPLRHGFDEYFGLPYSNDMWPRHPERPKDYPDLPLIEGERVIEYNPDQNLLTALYTERAIRFIEKNSERPFFLYLALNMPHVPLHAYERFRGKSGHGLYGDVVEEIDWAVGEVVAALNRNRLEQDTLVLFTSDNGPWLSYGEHAGSAGPLREGKGTTWEGGVRTPTLMQWPGRITPGSVLSRPVMTIDVLPTVARLTHTRPPAHPIDGRDVWRLITNPQRENSPHEAYLFYWGDELQAVRSGNWKLHLPHKYRTLAGRPGGSGGQPVVYGESQTALALFNLEEDVGETTDVLAKYPKIGRRIQEVGARMDAELRSGRREPGRRPA
jgi:arylsulfatase A-like enzyme